LPTPEAMIGGTVARVDALERQLQAAGATQAAAQETAQNAAAAREAATALGARVGALERRPPGPPSPEQGARITALEQRVAQLGATPAPDPAMPQDWAARIEALERRLTLAQTG